jgi:hypothetical protein
MQKYGSNYKKYPKWSLYKRWVRERDPPPYPFHFDEIDLPNSSRHTIGGTIYKIRNSKKLKSSNHHAILYIKDYMKKMLGTSDVTVDDIATFICVYTFNLPHDYNEKKINKENKSISNTRPTIQQQTTPQQETTSQQEITITLENQDMDNWENTIL